jgi:hypothetical protein
MPCLDAKALETDPEGMAFLRSVLRPDAGEAPAVPALPQPMPLPMAMAAPVPAGLPARARRSRRAAPLETPVG